MDETELYLVTSLYDEGRLESSFRVVRAESELAIATPMLACPHQWQHLLENARRTTGSTPIATWEPSGIACGSRK